jgi:hypothetical protein
VAARVRGNTFSPDHALSLSADYKKTKNKGMPIFLYVFADIRAHSLTKFQIFKKGLILRI